MNDTFKTGFVTFIGRPNVGKSTLMNRLIGQKVAITSSKPQTTRKRILTVYTDEEMQIIFLDTPGLTGRKNRLGDYMLKTAKDTLSEVDVICWIIEAGTVPGDDEKEIAEELSKRKMPVLLIMNKSDTVSDDALSATGERFKDMLPFADMVPVSALKSRGIEDVKEAIKKLLPYGPPLYDEDTLTDEQERAIVAEIVREKALRLLSDEVPHGIAVTVEKMRLRNRNGMTDPFREPEEADLMDIDASIICEKDSHKGIIIGKGGRMIKNIGTNARTDIETLVGCHVNLQLYVKVRKDWRDDRAQLKSLGYA